MIKRNLEVRVDYVHGKGTLMSRVWASWVHSEGHLGAGVHFRENES